VKRKVWKLLKKVNKNWSHELVTKVRDNHWHSRRKASITLPHDSAA